MSREEIKIDLAPLLAEIRRRIYAPGHPANDRQYFGDERRLKHAITWPATWLRSRGCTWSMDRYSAMILAKLSEIEQHGQHHRCTYFPSYLLKVLQDHFAHHSDSICAEGSKARNAFAQAIGQITQAQSSATRQAETAIDILAAAHSLLAKPAPRARKPRPGPPQLTLEGLL